MPTVTSATDAQRARALGRIWACERSDELVAAGCRRADADAQAAREAVEQGRLKCASKRSLEQWRPKLRDAPAGRGLAVLLDLPRSGRPAGPWRGTGRVYPLFCSAWLRLSKPTAAQSWRAVRKIAAAKGWRMPPVDACLRRLRREVPVWEIVRAREGVIALMKLYPHQVRTVKGLRPGQVINGDGHVIDIWCLVPQGKRGRTTRVGRGCLWAWQDVYTRRILAWTLVPHESADAVRVSLFRLLQEHGVPEHVFVDSTRAASAKWLTGAQPGRKRWRSGRPEEELPGLLRQLRIGYHVTKVTKDAGGRGRGSGQSKPVERAFRDLSAEIGKHPLLEGAYTGNNPLDKPEDHRSRAVSWEALHAVVEACIAEHNARPGRRTEIARERGESFDACWAREIRGVVVRRMSAAQASLLLLAAEDVMLDRSGCFTLKAGHVPGVADNRYGLPGNPQLLHLAGQRVVARFDPDNLHGEVHVHDREGRFICTARCIAARGFLEQSAARETARARNRMRKLAEQGLAARRNHAEPVRELDALPPPEAAPEAAPAAAALVAGGLPELPPRGSAPASSPPPAATEGARPG